MVASHLRRSASALTLTVLLALVFAPSVLAWQETENFKPPDDIAFRRATIMSEGTRMAAELFAPKNPATEKLPTIVMAHGWGGVASQLRPDAINFARAGYLVLIFDYRGWGASESRVVLTSPQPERTSDRKFTAEVLEVREVVDPIDQTTDLANAVSWIYGEPQCDREHIGLWGSSYSGGHVIYVAARDPRVKATVSQVPALDSRTMVLAGGQREKTFAEAAARTHGEIGYPEPGARVIGNLRGAPLSEKLMQYAPVEDIARADGCATLFILAENEELFDNREHGILAHERAKGPKKLIVIPKITHYGVYLGARKQAQQMAIDWFDEHLKPKK
jgi:dienelactone hydrolase